ncbi:urease subunit beta [Paenibacillus provencensis]|uniref:Urease subunit beta n=1 Tax=Paenibacillus provencensis TaxID=441151 RepID=A0ABW3PNP5_9BACL|nr:urease subunit beta [Paenibacillus sp. MER 78]MCM3127648.1 urease subunit beta [Paenibacillus sp. MER 78]
MIPGEYRLKKDDIICHPDRDTIQLTVINRGDRPVQIGSHVHFYEVNAQLDFDRKSAYGRRLHIPAGTAVRFEPGEEKPVDLTTFGGKRRIQGFNNLTNGSLDQPADEVKLRTFIERFGAPAANNEGDPS